MAAYEVWNRAIIQHFKTGIPLGNSVYLSVDEDVIAQIAANQDDLAFSPGEAVDDFRRAVRDRVVLQGRRVGLGSVAAIGTDGTPGGVAFLAMLVMSASRMANEGQSDEDHIDEMDFFRRLRELLGLDADPGRPTGLGVGDEEPLWLRWNAWLGAMGFVSTARRGRRNRTYVNYAISQTLLRKADKDRLRRIFSRTASQWQADLDGETVLIELRKETRLNSRYLLDILSRPGTRYQALTDSLYDLHESWRADPEMTMGSLSGTSLTLRCGLFREYDPIMGAIDYRLYPRTPAGRRADGGRLAQRGDVCPLEVERAGWFAPLDPVSAAELTTGIRYPVTGIDGVVSAVLPMRSFWVLVPDLGDPDSGFHASWRHPTLGEPAIVLIADPVLPLIQQLRDEGLVQWDGEPYPVPALDGWSEVRGCLVVSEALGGVFGDAQAIFEELRPATRLGISTRGGLRSPDRQGWITGHGPEVTVTGFEHDVELRVTRVQHDGEDEVVDKRTVQCLTPQTINAITPGTYRIDAIAGEHEAAPRLIRLVGWDDLSSALGPHYSLVTTDDWQILGATLRPIVTEVR